MKQLLFILMLLLPSLVKAESYTYNKLIEKATGSDNFSVDSDNEAYVMGTIEFDGKSITIDKKTYAVTAMKKENCYRYKGGMFRFIYCGEKLCYIQHFNYNAFYNYRIQHTAKPLTARNSG